VKQVNVETSNSVDAALSEDLASIPPVRHVLTERADGMLSVWIAVDDPTPEVRKTIYGRELHLLEEFPEIEFDFKLIYSLGRNAAEIATGAKVVYSRKD
jgi:hypothetical protein